ncbi:MAG: NYN domain-containing protein [Armatimonadota bacterium]
MSLSLFSAVKVVRAIIGARPSLRPGVRNVAVIADLDNISISLAEYGKRPDWHALHDFASRKGKVVAAEAFGETRSTAGYQSFVGALTKMGYKVHLSPATEGYHFRKAAPVDHSLVARTMALLLDYQIDEILISSGDADFLPLIAELRSRGVVVTLVAPDGCTSRKLAAAADEVVSFTQVGTTRLNSTVLMNRRPAVASAQAH